MIIPTTILYNFKDCQTSNHRGNIHTLWILCKPILTLFCCIIKSKGFYRLSWVIHHKIEFLMKNLINSHEFCIFKFIKKNEKEKIKEFSIIVYDVIKGFFFLMNFRFLKLIQFK